MSDPAPATNQYSEFFDVAQDDTELRNIRFENDSRCLTAAEAAEVTGDVKGAQELRRKIGD